MNHQLRNINILLSIALLTIYLPACDEVRKLDSSDWKKYEWIMEILGEEIVAENVVLDLDANIYTFNFHTLLSPEHSLEELDERAIQSGWMIERTSPLSRKYTKEKDLISILWDENTFKFYSSPLYDSEQD